MGMEKGYRIWRRESVFILAILDNLAWVLVVVFYLLFAAFKPQAMLNLDILLFIFYTLTTLGLLVLAESVALISGNFDVSIDRITGFVGVLAAKILSRFSVNPYFGVFLPVAFGFLCGCLNGFLVGSLGLNPFISTLATSMVFSGLLLVTSSTSIWNLPSVYLYVGGNAEAAILVFSCILVFSWFFLRYTRLGRNIYAVGGNPSAALMLGINLKKTLFVTYCIVGTFSGVAALFYTGFCGSAPINMATNALFPAFAGAVLGGISLRGGRGSVINAFAGGLLIGIINAGLAMFAISEEIRQVTTGLLVIGAILIGNLREILRERVSRAL
jgi:ribose/xylose/arabinose/galactoside ABC-type transport system permease subunit